MDKIVAIAAAAGLLTAALSSEGSAPCGQCHASAQRDIHGANSRLADVPDGFTGLVIVGSKSCGWCKKAWAYSGNKSSRRLLLLHVDELRDWQALAAEMGVAERTGLPIAVEFSRGAVPEGAQVMVGFGPQMKAAIERYR